MINTDPAYWNGCTRGNRPPVRFGESNREDVPLRNWISRCVPSYNQRGDSCVGEGWANLLEAILREYVDPDAIPNGYQLDGYKIYWKAKQMFYNGCLAGGLLIPEGFEAMKELGWIPRDSILVTVPQDWISQGEALLIAPLVVGHIVHAGWFRPSRTSGCLDHDYPANSMGGGHCTCRVGRHIQTDHKFYSGLNSWGQYYAWNGVFMMDEAMDQLTALDSPHSLAIPGGFARLRDVEGWKAGLISTPGDQQTIGF
jgi:hypothetical protein